MEMVGMPVEEGTSTSCTTDHCGEEKTPFVDAGDKASTTTTSKAWIPIFICAVLFALALLAIIIIISFTSFGPPTNNGMVPPTTATTSNITNSASTSSPLPAISATPSQTPSARPPSILPSNTTVAAIHIFGHDYWIHNTTVMGLDLRSLPGHDVIPTDLGLLTAMTELVLAYGRRKAPIPTELGLLTDALTQMRLVDNQFTGPIPTQLGLLTRLTDLHLNKNQLTGAIPTELGQLTALRYLDIGSNRLMGPIPTELGFLGSSLNTLSLSSNELGIGTTTTTTTTTTIPTELGQLTALQYLYLGYTKMMGSIPSELGRLTALTYLELQGNHLTGTIPTEIGRLTALPTLELWDNPLLVGRIPSELCALSHLQSLYYSKCQSGRAPLDCNCSDGKCKCF